MHNNAFLVVALILMAYIVLSVINVYLALKCPKCRKSWGLIYQAAHKRTRCKICGYVAKEDAWQPPKKPLYNLFFRKKK
jgi:hypothetical protein